MPEQQDIVIHTAITATLTEKQIKRAIKEFLVDNYDEFPSTNFLAVELNVEIDRDGKPFEFSAKVTWVE